MLHKLSTILENHFNTSILQSVHFKWNITSWDYHLITSQDRAWAVAYCFGRDFLISTDIETVGQQSQKCRDKPVFGGFIRSQCHMSPLNKRHSLSISNQSRFALSAQADITAGQTAGHCCYSHSTLTDLQSLIEVDSDQHILTAFQEIVTKFNIFVLCT